MPMAVSSGGAAQLAGSDQFNITQIGLAFKELWPGNPEIPGIWRRLGWQVAGVGQAWGKQLWIADRPGFK